jgi:competence protein ComEC
MIANHKGEIPAVLLLLPFLMGIWRGLNFLSNTNITWLSAVFIFVSAAFIALNFNYNRFKLYKHRWLGGSLIAIIIFLLGWLSVTRYCEPNNNNHFSKVSGQYLVVKINNEPNVKNGLSRFTADVQENINNGRKSLSSGSLLITIKDSSAKNLYYGDELLIPAKYNPVDPPFVPAAFNYKQYLANQNIFYLSFLLPKQYVLISKNTGNPIIAYSLRLRQQLVQKLKRNMRDTDAIAVASTLILGYKADLSNDVLQAYSKTGTIHVLSVSGAHVAILYLLLAFILRFLDRYRHGKLIKTTIIIAVIWYYSLLSGFSPAVCRAAVMISMVIIGKTFSRYINTLNVLAISAFILLLYDPFFITDVGFQLSYLAVFGLIVVQPVVYNLFKFKNKWADKLWALCSVSLAAQVITFPLSAYYFHQFPVYFLISNLFIIIPTTVIMYSGILFLLLPQIPVVSGSIAYILEKSIVLMNKTLAVIEHAPYASINKIWLTTSEYLLLFAIIVGLFYFLYNKKSWLLVACTVCVLLLSLSVSIKRIRLSRTNSIAWLSLKKHTGIILKNGNNAIVFTDLKSTDKIYQYSVQPYLDSCQMTNIKLLNLDKDIKTSWLIKKNDLIQFFDKRIFIYNGQLKNNLFSQKLKTDYIYVTGNKESGLTAINDNFDYHTLILSGDNSDDLIHRMGQLKKNKPAGYITLKRNKSFISISN